MLWNQEKSGYGGQPGELLSPKDVTCYGPDHVAVLDVIRQTIQIFDLHGTFQRVIHLRKVWGREPNYPTDLAADASKGFLLNDFNATQTFLRLDENGAIRFAGVPRLADGRPISTRDGFTCSPQGDVWLCDGDALIRLTTNAFADLILGVASAKDLLSEAWSETLGPEDSLYVADRKSHVGHVFDASGKPLGRCVPKVEDVAESSQVSHVAVSPDGQVYVSLDLCSSSYVHFDAGHQRLGRVTTDVDPITQTWHFQPSNNLCWVVAYNHVFLVKGTQDVLRRVSRRADGRWVEYPGEASVAPDGSLAIASCSQAGEAAISLYSSEGDPISTFETPFKRYTGPLAYNGRHVFVLQDEGLYVFKADGTRVGKMKLPEGSKNANWSGPFVAAGGHEVWLVELSSSTVHRFAAP